MPTPFSAKKLDCNAQELLDALTILHDLGIWDEYIYKYGVENPAGLAERVRNEQDQLIAEYEERVTKNRVTLRFKNHGGKKINFIKILREFSGLGLADAKKVSEITPWVLPWSYTCEEVNSSEFIKWMKEIGADFESVPCKWLDIRERSETLHKKITNYYYTLGDFVDRV
jgi:ribosomal protein L7/L12